MLPLYQWWKDVLHLYQWLAPFSPVLLSVFVAKHDLEFMILLPPAPGCSNYRHALFLCRAGD